MTGKDGKYRSRSGVGRTTLTLTMLALAFLLCLIALRPATGSAQGDAIGLATPEWAELYNGPANCCEHAPRMAVDHKGNVILTGQSTTTREFPAGPYNDDVVTIKYDSEGKELWVRRFDGPGQNTDVPYDITADDQGNVYVAGYTAGVDSQFLTLKYDADGNLRWSRFAGSELYNNAFALDVDNQGNVYVTGREAYRFRFDNSPVYQFLTVKYDANGNELWQRTFETSQQAGAEAADVKADNAGNVYVTGKGYLPQVENEGHNIFTIKYDSNGNESWIREFGGDGPEYYNNDTATKLRVDAQANVFVLGSTTRGPNQNDVLVLKYTSSGNQGQTLLLAHPDNEISTDFAFDDSGNIYLLSLKLISIPDYPAFIFDVVTLKLNASGIVVWRNAYGSSGGGNDWGRGIVLDNRGDVYVGVSAQQGTGFNENYVLLKYKGADGSREYEKSFDGSGHDRDALSAAAVDHIGNVFLTGESQTEWSSGRSVDFMTLKVTTTVAKGKPRPRPGLSRKPGQFLK